MEDICVWRLPRVRTVHVAPLSRVRGVEGQCSGTKRVANVTGHPPVPSFLYPSNTRDQRILFRSLDVASCGHSARVQCRIVA
jgi:hypothetical protein